MKKINTLFCLLFIQFTFSQVDVIYNDLVWSDEFDTNGAVNATKWHHQTQLPAGGNWFNGEEQHYTNQLANSSVTSGILNITAKKETFTDQGITKPYTSARLNSKFAFLYGRVDIRAKVPKSQGTWPALWMLAKNVNEDGGFFDAAFGTVNWPACGEIDIMEYGITPSQPNNYVQSALHTTSSFGNTTNVGGTIANNLGTAYHVYSMNWSPNQITFLLDGVAYYTYNPAVKTPNNWPFTSEQYILLNIAMGGVAGTIPSTFTQANMEVDYVRVYQNVAVDNQVPTNFTTTLGVVTSSTVQLLVNAQDNSGSLIYNVSYGGQNVQVAGVSGVQNSIVIPNLSPNTNYTFTITATDNAGNAAANNPIIINATTSSVIGCSGTSNLAQQGSFSTGYTYNYETIGNDVKVTYTLLDTDKVGVVAYLWRQSPFTEYAMTALGNNSFTYTITNQTQGATINYGVKFAYAGGLSVTNYYSYQVGNNCALGTEKTTQNISFQFNNPAKETLYIQSNETIKNIEIIDLKGNSVFKTKTINQEININHLSKGVYFINANIDDRIITKKLIVE